MFGRIFFGPPDWLVKKFILVIAGHLDFGHLFLAAIGAIFWGREVLYVTVLSIVALIPNFSSETPVEEEEV